jgi:hypothetical protein
MSTALGEAACGRDVGSLAGKVVHGDLRHPQVRYKTSPGELVLGLGIPMDAATNLADIAKAEVRHEPPCHASVVSFRPLAEDHHDER